eukprot:CAMPEP_0114587448 /NCGR_PEP_ID=MMETSP0125-20121206/10399_1 /TAXON_ID=485358 ORGANISM="Aristerostoma sp., Strain ATCC 50986" /NCGR_SAMPLE_ID=MMETSP0125 /ASSEMBLY_ACC=CAM_ASM_000245 /LENGTH=107 /DNA_ID=CAMNT_0001783351 /DNA_START=512 /DNA_END=835 /DNA_ORIENTATION=-
MSIGIVDAKYHKLGIGELGLWTAINKHPIISRANKVIAENEGLPGVKMCTAIGLECYWEMPYPKFAKVKGLEELSQLPKRVAAKKINPKYYPAYTIYYTDRTKTPKL